ncbi:MAG: serine/threonine protein kinase, partial [Planctomycetota bacterium]
MKDKQEERLLAKLAYKKGMITREILEAALQKLDSFEGSILDYLVQARYITSIQKENLLKEREKLGKIGDYKILSLIGEGGMGKVFMALHQPTQNICAIKVLHNKLGKTPDFVKRFQREGRTGLLLEHPNIVKCLEMGKHNQSYFMAMEWVDGISLKERIEEQGPLSEEEALTILSKICHALAQAEDLGIVHRDIKAENILLTQKGEPKLADFGLVRHEGNTTLTQTGTFMGTPSYISPEQAMGDKDIDIRSDIYSLGITLFYMLTGELPYQSDNPLSLCHKQIHEPMPDPRERNYRISEATTKLLWKMTEKDREKRFQSPREIIEAVKEILQKGDSSLLQAQQPPLMRTSFQEDISPQKENLYFLLFSQKGLIYCLGFFFLLFLALLLTQKHKETTKDKDIKRVQNAHPKPKKKVPQKKISFRPSILFSALDQYQWKKVENILASIEPKQKEKWHGRVQEWQKWLKSINKAENHKNWKNLVSLFQTGINQRWDEKPWKEIFPHTFQHLKMRIMDFARHKFNFQVWRAKKAKELTGILMAYGLGVLSAREKIQEIASERFYRFWQNFQKEQRELAKSILDIQTLLSEPQTLFLTEIKRNLELKALIKKSKNLLVIRNKQEVLLKLQKILWFLGFKEP